ncbi:MAG: glycosyltransferase family 4 protein [bacterium]|nr:glycosyltransferase family 4 protein [bacterium]
MKIICISHWRIPSEKTMAPYMMRVAEAFAKEGNEVEFWIPRRRNALKVLDPFEYHLIERNFRLRYLPVIDLMGVVPGRISFLLMLASFTISVFFFALFQSRKSFFYFFDLRDAWLVLLLSRRAFCEIHMYYKSSLDVVNRWGFARMRGIIAATKPLRAEIQRQYGVPQDKILHAPCGVNSERFALDLSREDARRALGLPQDGRFIFYIGHLFPVKGVDVLFDVHPLLAPGEVLYFIGGTDEDITRYRKKWEAAGAPKNIVIVGRKPHQEIPTWLRAADILTIPNTARDPAGSIESSPSKLMEYMASGRPIVASDVPAIRDVLDSSMGYFAEPDSPQAIAAQVHAIFTDPTLAEKKARAARAFASTDLNWSARACNIMHFIEQR